MINYVQGDLLDPSLNFDVIVHGCNCFHTMRRGVAKAIKEKYPQAYEADKNLTEKGDESKLGSLSMAFNESGEGPEHIVNAYTQYRYGRDKVHVDYEALGAAMVALSEIFDADKYSIAFPKIGCGLAGGDWNVVEAIINKIFAHKKVTVVEYDGE